MTNYPVCHSSPSVRKTDAVMAATDPSWSWFRFRDLHPRLLYNALRLRQEIFIVEQDVPYADLDGRDFDCLHLVGTFADEVVAYLRVLPQNLFKPGSYSFGRVTVRHDFRGKGIGANLVARGLERIDAMRGNAPIEISSQYYLEGFYQQFGFTTLGEQYIEDKIPHIAMIRR